MNIRKPVIALSMILVLTVFNATAGEQQNDQLSGTWTVDLRPTPDTDPYLQTFTIDEVEGNRFSGSFYGDQVHILIQVMIIDPGCIAASSNTGDYMIGLASAHTFELFFYFPGNNTLKTGNEIRIWMRSDD